MDNSMKVVRIPIADNGLHHHKPNVPVVSTANFFEPYVVWLQDLKKGEKFDRFGGAYGRTQPFSVPALVTGRFKFYSFFCPYRYIFAPWYEFHEGVRYQMSNGQNQLFHKAPYTQMKNLSFCFYDNSSVATVYTGSDEYDFRTDAGTNYRLTALGAKVLKLLNSLGYNPTWSSQDDTQINLLSILCYLKIYLECVWPAQYVGNTAYNLVAMNLKNEKYSYDLTDVKNLFNALQACSDWYYDSSLFDAAFDQPVSPNSGSSVSYNIYEQSQNVENDPEFRTVVSMNLNQSSSDVEDTPEIGNPDTDQNNMPFVGRVTKFTLDALDDLSKFIKRKQLAGNRLMEQFLVDRGKKLSHDVTRRPYSLGEGSIEIDVTDVENNSADNLGELAGKGSISTDRNFLHFKGDVDDDGMLMVIAVAVPDADVAVYNNPFIYYVNQLQFHHSQFDKLGVEPIPQFCVATTNNGQVNEDMIGKHFGYWPMYTGQSFYSPKLLGDFNVPSRGGTGLQKYHTFRLQNPITIEQNDGVFHSYDWVRTFDSIQYQRLFASDKIDNLILSIRWFGDDYLEKLLPADSYDWSDDEFKRKVDVLYQGMKLR